MPTFIKREIRYIIMAILMLFLLLRVQTAHLQIDVHDHFLLFHTLLELFSIFVSLSIFVQSWVTYATHRIKSQYFIGLVFLAVACFDIFHTITYKGMPFFDDELARSRATAFWIIARLTESVGIALFIFRPNQFMSIKRLPGAILTVLYAAICSIIIVTIPNELPELINENGVTPLKIALEYVITSIFFITFITLLVKYIRQSRPNTEALRMILSVFTIMVGELFFTLYTHVYDFENLLGHIFKFVGFIYLYRSVYFPEIQKIITDKEHAQEQQLETELKLYEMEKNLSRQVFEAHEEERKRVSRELHDSIGQSLYSILVTLNIMHKDQTPEKNDESLQIAKDMTQQAMKEVKEIARSLRPSALDDFGFVTALRSFCESYEQIHGINVHFTIKGDKSRLNSEIETALYRICQEALNNTAKYAKATDVHLTIHFQTDSIELTIQDNGIGFDLEQYLHGETRKGIGLYSMKERAEGVGGSATFHSAMNEGTTIYITVPNNKNAKVQ